MVSQILVQAKKAMSRAASSKIIEISHDGLYIDQFLESSLEFKRTLDAYDILRQFWPLAPILSSNYQNRHIRMLFCGLPIRLSQSNPHLRAVSLIFKDQNTTVKTVFDQSLVRYELDLFYDWFLSRRLGWSSRDFYQDFLSLFSHFFHHCPKRIIHRDYHSENILQALNGQIYLIDYQDMMQGPYLYDYVSLMEDAYHDTKDFRSCSESLFYNWAYPISKDFKKDYQICALQRVMKMVGIFSRLSLRDKKCRYEQYIPRLLQRLLILSPSIEHQTFFRQALSLFR